MLGVLIFLHFLAVHAQLSNHDSCITPDRQPGTCVEVNSCKPMVDLLGRVKQPLTEAIRARLKAYQCGFSGNAATICCPATPIVLDDLEVTSRLPDVSKHRNINLLPKNCGYLDTVDKIVHGNKTGLFEFPWMALLSYEIGGGLQFECGGTIINNKHILTAAHCVTHIQYKLVGVRVGEHDIRTTIDCEEDDDGEEVCAPPVQDLTIEKVTFHPEYDPTFHTNDIAVIRVSPINLSLENSRPVCLPLAQTRDFNFTNKNVVVTGWGYTETGRHSPDLLQVELPIVPLEECKVIYKNLVPPIHLNDNQICAGGKGISDSCGGDSGGPLHAVGLLFGEIRLIQQGIVSFGPRRCGEEPIPGVYTRVAAYMDWVLDNISL